MKIIIALGATAVLFTATFANAHGLATTKTELVGNYLVQMEYDTLGNISAEDNASFSFELLNPDTKESADFDRVFARIIKKDGPPFALAFTGNLMPTEGFTVKSARANIYIPTEGDYKIELRYYKASQELAKHTFEIPVDPPYSFGKDANKTADVMKYLWVITLIGGIIIGMVASKLLKSTSEHGKKD